MASERNRQWLLARRPEGMIRAEDFQWVEQTVAEPGEGEILVRNLYLSCDPTQRGWMARDGYLPAVRVGEVMRAFAVGQVVRSRCASLPVGEFVQGLFGWQDFIVTAPGTPASPVPVPQGVPLETAMSLFGITGLTAYFGLLEIGQPQPGETVVVSGAAGATGSVAGQIAKIQGCRTVGLAGGAGKCRYLTSDLGFDAAIDYKSEDVPARLRETCPDGVDVFFDNVGGEILDAVLARLAQRGRIVLSGAISRYNDTEVGAGPRNYLNLIVKRGRMEGFIVLDYLPRAAEAVSAMAAWVREGRLKDRVDVQVGLENAPAALMRLFRGENLGKQLVKIADAV